MSLFDAFVSGATGKKKVNNQTTAQTITWQCRYCGRTYKTSPYRIPGSGVGGACRVVGGREIPHEWMKVY